MLSCIIFGGSGATGREIITQLSQSSTWQTVYIVTRRMIPLFDSLNSDPRFKFIVTENVMDESLIMDKVTDSKVDAVFNTLGTQVKVGEKLFRQIDKEWVLQSAELARKLKARQFSHITCKGSSASSMLLYLRVKGEVENELSKIQLDNISVFKPGVLVGRDNDSRCGEKLASWIPFIDKITTKDLATGIIKEAESNLLNGKVNGYKAYSNTESKNWAK